MTQSRPVSDLRQQFYTKKKKKIFANIRINTYFPFRVRRLTRPWTRFLSQNLRRSLLSLLTKPTEDRLLLLSTISCLACCYVVPAGDLTLRWGLSNSPMVFWGLVGLQLLSPMAPLLPILLRYFVRLYLILFVCRISIWDE